VSTENEPKLLLTIVLTTHNLSSIIGHTLSFLPYDKPSVELIIVDDSSTDDTVLQIRNFFNVAKFEHYILLQPQEKNGAGRNRNVGLSVARGRWILFLDGDDFFNYTIWPQLEQLMLQRHDCDILIFKSKNRSWSSGRQTQFVDSDLKRRILHGNSSRSFTPGYMPSIFGTQPSSATKVFNRDFLTSSNISFPEKIIFEDYEHHLSSLLRAKKILLSDLFLFYATTERSGQITSRKDDSRLDSFHVINFAVKKLFKSLDPLDSEDFLVMLLDFIHWNILSSRFETRKVLLDSLFRDNEIAAFFIETRDFQTQFLSNTLNTQLFAKLDSSLVIDYYDKRISLNLIRFLFATKARMIYKSFSGVKIWAR